MRRAVVALTCILALILCSCALEKVKVEEHVIDARYTESYIGVETTYNYEFDLFSSTDTLHKMPDMHSVVYPAKYEVQYRITYDDGSTKAEWREVERDIYEQALAELGDVE